jgi:hypothetical protein
MVIVDESPVLSHHPQPAPRLQALLCERKVPSVEHPQEPIDHELRRAGSRAWFDVVVQNPLGLFQRV